MDKVTHAQTMFERAQRILNHQCLEEYITKGNTSFHICHFIGYLLWVCNAAGRQCFEICFQILVGRVDLGDRDDIHVL